MNTPISAQGHEPLHQRLTTLNYEVPTMHTPVAGHQAHGGHPDGSE
jgi:hypothetical protein